tara:strand:+ start:9821 stop:10846 length:1026 start_codon:yes stop_codon:yes gene_type:complete
MFEGVEIENVGMQTPKDIGKRAIKMINALQALEQDQALSDLNVGAIQRIVSKNEQKNIQMLVFYSNPRTGTRELALEAEMRTIMQTFSTNSYLMIPGCTFKDFADSLKLYKPSIICFTGHAEGYQIIFTQSHSSNRPEAIRAVDFKQAIDEAYKEDETKRLKLAMFFACKSCPFATKVFGDDCSQKPCVIAWQSILDDKAGTLFSNKLMLEVKELLLTNPTFEAEHILQLFRKVCEHFVTAGEIKFGDPDAYRINWRLHLEEYQKKLEEYFGGTVLGHPFPALRLSEWRAPIEELRFQRPINTCQHCFPPVHGEPCLVDFKKPDEPQGTNYTLYSSLSESL